MSVHLITGKNGENHITPQCDSFFVGQMTNTQGFNDSDTLKGRYVLDIGNKVNLTVTDPNIVTIEPGYIFADGRLIQIQEPITFTIPTGTLGKWFITQIHIRYNSEILDANKLAIITPFNEYDTLTIDREIPAQEKNSIMDGDSYVMIPIWELRGRGNTIITSGRIIPVLDSDVIESDEIIKMWRRN